jgi:steroid 5-alpha reductase family enzyme
MDFFTTYFILGLVILGLMALLWLVSLALKNSSIVDIFWGTGFVIVTWVAFTLTPEGFTTRKILLNILVTLGTAPITSHPNA